MDGSSPIEAFLGGRLGEDELLAEVDRIVAHGSDTDRTLLVTDWRTKSGRIRAVETRRRLDSRVEALAWLVPDGTPAQPGRPLQPGDILAHRFVIEQRIGAGGMGTVFKARDLRREEAQDRHPHIAVKTLNMDVLQREDSLKILQREARKAQGLAHPNIVRVHDFDKDGDTFFLTMELLEGTPLDALLQQHGLQGMKLAEALPIIEQVASALQFAHGEGIVHSDLKPANIIVLPNGRVKVIDFGISRALPNPQQLTIERTTFDVQALGALTPAYASPEMIEGLDPDPRDDVFALACIVYELLTGRHPFGRVPATVALAGSVSARPPANLSAAQWRALQGGLSFERAKRTATPGQLLAGLTSQPASRFGRRAAWGTAALALLLVLGAGGYFVVRNGEQAARLQQQRAAEAAVQHKAAEEAAQQLAQQQAAQQAAQQLAQQQAARAAAQQAAEQQAAEQKAAEAAAQRAAEQKAAEAAAPPVTSSAAAPPPPTAVDAIGAPQIAEAQRLLNALGLSVGTPDGVAGARTEEMLRVYQLSLGQRATGELTTALLGSLRGSAPPPSARAGGLFALAAQARAGDRPADAVRLYETGLKLAPGDTTALLALGDLQRDRKNLDAARRAYETVAQGGGPSAAIARQRIAALPSPQVTPPASTAANPPAIEPAAPRPPVAAQAFDGTYTGTQQATGLNNPNCAPTSPATIAVRDNRLSAGSYATTVAPDGTFSAYRSIGGSPPRTEKLEGRIQGGVIEADTTNPFCRYHLTLRKSG